jgi:2-iminobutanoate/2-iminopropanoate deaminase
VTAEEYYPKYSIIKNINADQEQQRFFQIVVGKRISGNKKFMKRIIKTSNAPAPIGPYNQAVEVNNTLYVSGQIAINPADGNLVMLNILREATQVLENISAILKEAGYSFSDVVKTTIFLSDMNNFSAVNDVYANYFTDNFPARETVEVAGLPKNVNVEISVIAVK